MRPFGRSLRALAVALLLAPPPARAGSPPSVRAHVASEEGLLAGSFWFRTDRGSVLIGAPFLLDDARSLREALERDGAWPLGAIVLLSGRPEGAWGAAALVGESTRVWASKSAAARLAGDFSAERMRFVRAGLALERLPRQPPRVTNTFAGSLNLGFEGFTLRLIEAEAGARSPTVAVIPETGELFAGDLVSLGVHPLVDDLDVGPWRSAIASLGRLRPRRVYPGRGPAAGPEALDVALGYLGALREAVAPLARSRRGSGGASWSSASRALERRYRDWRLPRNLDRLVPAELERQRHALAETIE